MRQCKQCNKLHPLDAYPVTGKTRGTRSLYCPACVVARAAQERAARIASYQKNAGKNRAAHLRWRRMNQEKRTLDGRLCLLRKYGVTMAWWDTTLAAQGGGCAICGGLAPESTSVYGAPRARLVVDHNHETRKARALLCPRCNHVVGVIERAGTLWPRALEYLAAHST